MLDWNNVGIGMDLYEHHYWWRSRGGAIVGKAMPLDSDEQWSNEHPERRFVQGHIAQCI